MGAYIAWPKISFHEVLVWGQRQFGFHKCKVVRAEYIGTFGCFELKYGNKNRFVCCEGLSLKEGDEVDFDPHLSTNPAIVGRFRNFRMCKKFANVLVFGIKYYGS